MMETVLFSVTDPGRYLIDPDPDPTDVKKRFRIRILMKYDYCTMHTHDDKQVFI